MHFGRQCSNSTNIYRRRLSSSFYALRHTLEDRLAAMKSGYSPIQQETADDAETEMFDADRETAFSFCIERMEGNWKKNMARKPGTKTNTEFVLFDVLYEDGTQRSNRKVPSSALGGL